MSLELTQVGQKIASISHKHLWVYIKTERHLLIFHIREEEPVSQTPTETKPLTGLIVPRLYKFRCDYIMVSIKIFQTLAIAGVANHFYNHSLNAKILLNVRNNHKTYFAKANLPQRSASNPTVLWPFKYVHDTLKTKIIKCNSA